MGMGGSVKKRKWTDERRKQDDDIFDDDDLIYYIPNSFPSLHSSQSLSPQIHSSSIWDEGILDWHGGCSLYSPPDFPAYMLI